VRTLLPLLARAHSMISIDTGPAHAAAALGTPTVALFGKQNSVLFRPGGPTTPAVAVTGSVDGVQDIMGITAEAVIAAWSAVVRRDRKSTRLNSSHLGISYAVFCLKK